MFRHARLCLMIYLWTLFVNVLLSPVSCLTIARRNDDVSVQSLVSLVQQQAATIQSLQARVDALESSDRAHGDSISKINAKIGKTVAFSAHMGGHDIDVGLTSPFVFDVVVTNVGDSYSKHTGIFLAPHDGVYVFYFMMINDNNSPTIHAAIEKNGQVLAVGTSDGVGSYNLWDDGSALVTTHLTKGDQVYVKRVDAGTKVWGGVYTNFSGFLLSADP